MAIRRPGIRSFVWTMGATQEGLDGAMESSAACGFRLIELAYLWPEKFDPDRLAKRAQSLDIAVRDTWTESMTLARHAKAFIDLKLDEAARRRATNAQP